MRLFALIHSATRQLTRAGVIVVLMICLGRVQGETSPSGVAGPEAKRMVVVAPQAFHAALREFISYKDQLLPTELVSLERILKTTPGADDPEKLKRFLYNRWRNEHLGYALLVGDVDVLPVRFMVLDRVTPAAFDYAFYPSDLYYSDLAKADGSFEDWNARRDSFHAGYFGEVRGEKNKQDPINYDEVDYRPELAVGRWPVSTPEEARRVATKSMAHERMVIGDAGPGIHRVAFLAVGGWVDSRHLLDGLADKMAGSWQVEKRYFKGDNEPEDILPPNNKQVRGLYLDGVGLVVHTGHGASDAWDQCFSVRDLDTLTNCPGLPVVISAGCSTAYFAPLPPYDGYVDVDGGEHVGTDRGEKFDAPPPPPAPYQRGRFNPTGLGEQLVKREGVGAAAYIGCDTGSQPCALTLVEGFVTAVSQAQQPRLGDCWAAAIRYYYDKEGLADLKPNSDWYPPSIFFQGMKFMVFGDPSLRLR